MGESGKGRTGVTGEQGAGRTGGGAGGVPERGSGQSAFHSGGTGHYTVVQTHGTHTRKEPRSALWAQINEAAPWLRIRPRVPHSRTAVRAGDTSRGATRGSPLPSAQLF